MEYSRGVWNARCWNGGVLIGVVSLGGVVDGGGNFGVGDSCWGVVVGFFSKLRIRLSRYLGECWVDYWFMLILTVGKVFDPDGWLFCRVRDVWFKWFARVMERSAVASGDSPMDCSVAWFVEYQKRGAPHLHGFYTHRVLWDEVCEKWAECLEKCGVMSFLCKESRDRFSRTSTKFERLRCGMDGARSYSRKYASKSAQKEVLDELIFVHFGRWWGVRGLRESVGCHVRCGDLDVGSVWIRRLVVELDRFVEDGRARKLRWKYGDGAVYFLVTGEIWASSGIGSTSDRNVMHFVLDEKLEVRGYSLGGGGG